jgi:hypothetical protein
MEEFWPDTRLGQLEGSSPDNLLAITAHRANCALDAMGISQHLFRATARLRLERAQEIDDVLALPSLQPIEMVDDLICLAILAPVGFDSLH